MDPARSVTSDSFPRVYGSTAFSLAQNRRTAIFFRFHPRRRREKRRVRVQAAVKSDYFYYYCYYDGKAAAVTIDWKRHGGFFFFCASTARKIFLPRSSGHVRACSINRTAAVKGLCVRVWVEQNLSLGRRHQVRVRMRKRGRATDRARRSRAGTRCTLPTRMRRNVERFCWEVGSVPRGRSGTLGHVLCNWATVTFRTENSARGPDSFHVRF